MPVPTLEQKLAWLKPSPPTEEEVRCMEALGLSEYEVGLQRTNDILDEAMEVFVRSSRSSMGVAGDSMVALFCAQGDMVNASCGTYLHAIIQPALIKYILTYYHDNPGIRDGDIWFSNDALYGGIHNPDQVVLMPIFADGDLIGWTGAAVHTSETGAIEPGGMPVSAKSRFEEGLCTPPIKIGQNFELSKDFLELYTLYCIRAPQMVIDLRARCSAADRARVRILELVNKYGKEYVVGLFRKMLVVGEEAARKRIRSWPDGRFRSVNFNDGVGLSPGLVRSCSLTLIKEGDRLVFDFTGTSPDNLSPYNTHGQGVIGHISNFMFEYVFHDLPITSSTFAPIDFVFPEGSCLNPDPRAATSNSVMIATGTMSAVHSVFGKMMYCTQDWRQVTASQGNAGNAMVISGISQWETLYSDMIAYSLNSEGQGGRVHSDGINAFGFPWCVFGRCPNVELLENEFPLLVPVSLHWTDSCGHGKYRGGAGTVQLWVAYHGKQVWFLCIADNSKLQTPQGLFGGYAPCTVPGISIRKADILERLKHNSISKLDFVNLISKREINGEWIFEYFARSVRPFEHGDVMTFGFATGGAGYGDPLERDPQLVLNDVVDQIVSPWSAKNVYGVVLDEAAERVEQEETEKLRQQMRKDRIKRGVPYAEFLSRWESLHPPEDILTWFGSWPEGRPVRRVVRP